MSVIVSLIFVFYGQIKDLKVQLQEVRLDNERLRDEAVALTSKALEMATITRKAEEKALMQKQIADKTMAELQECKKNKFTMKKNITIAILTLVTLTFIVYAQIKTNDAEKTALEAAANLEMAEKNQKMAEIETQKAVEVATEAMRSEAEANRIMAELKACQSK